MHIISLLRNAIQIHSAQGSRQEKKTRGGNTARQKDSMNTTTRMHTRNNSLTNSGGSSSKQHRVIEASSSVPGGTVIITNTDKEHSSALGCGCCVACVCRLLFAAAAAAAAGALRCQLVFFWRGWSLSPPFVVCRCFCCVVVVAGFVCLLLAFFCRGHAPHTHTCRRRPTCTCCAGTSALLWYRSQSTRTDKKKQRANHALRCGRPHNTLGSKVNERPFILLAHIMRPDDDQHKEKGAKPRAERAPTHTANGVM